MSPSRGGFAPFAIRLAVCVGLASGCDNASKRVNFPSYNGGAGSAALAEYDTNRDGRIDGEELERSPALKAALAQIDQDGDKAVTAAEIDARIEHWKKSRVAAMPVSCKILLNRKPLGQANVTMEPESFLGPSLRAATGVTDADGVAVLSIGDPTLPGVAPGFYKLIVEGTNDGTTFRYATGCEVAFDAGWASEGIIVAAFVDR